jgi:hypothetical protein
MERGWGGARRRRRGRVPTGSTNPFLRLNGGRFYNLFTGVAHGYAINPHQKSDETAKAKNKKTGKNGKHNSKGNKHDYPSSLFLER